MIDDDAAPETVFAPAPPAPLPVEAFLASPFTFLFTLDDHLVLTSWASGDFIVTLSGRRRDPSGDYRTFRFDHHPNVDRSFKRDVMTIGPGYLLNLFARVSNGTCRYGQCVIRVDVVRGSPSIGAANLVPVGTMLLGPIGTMEGRAWPGSPLISAFEAPPLQTTNLVLGTAAGAEIVVPVPTNARWEVVAFGATLTTSAVVANRQARLVFNTPNQVARVVQPSVSTAGVVHQYAWAQGLPYETAPIASSRMAGLPIGLELVTGDTIETQTVGLDPGDQWGSIAIKVNERIDTIF